MGQVDERLFKIWGFNTTGDFGALTFYTSRRRRLVFFSKAPPLEPASPTQHVMRNRFRTAALAWRKLPPAQRAAWNDAATQANLGISGYNLWVYWQTKRDPAPIQTIERASGVNLISP